LKNKFTEKQRQYKIIGPFLPFKTEELRRLTKGTNPEEDDFKGKK